MLAMNGIFEVLGKNKKYIDRHTFPPAATCTDYIKKNRILSGPFS
jgi:hypothetical protein